MKEIIPYLFFNGNCRQAMEFYKECLGGELVIMTFADAPNRAMPENTPKEAVMHSNLKTKNCTLMASDSPNQAVTSGNNAYLSIDCDSLDEIETLFNALGKNGKVVRALEDTFWGARFGMLTDQYGIHWMFNYDK